MKIGIISDIHANLAKLRRARALLREQGAEVILCAGDLVDGETEGDAVVKYVRKQGFLCVQGNHDAAMSHARNEDWLDRWDESAFGRMPPRYRTDLLGEDSRAFLRDLPIKRCFEWDNRRVLLTHASTWDQVTYVYPKGRSEYFSRIAAQAQADIVILGHTHIPMAVEVAGVWIFNPGSVDGSRIEPYLSTCAVLDLSVTRYQVFDIDTRCPTSYVFTKLGDLGRDMHESGSE